MSGEAQTKDLRVTIVGERVTGADYKALAVKYSLGVSTVTRWCKEAMAQGLVTAKQLRYVPPLKATREDYDARWLERVKERTVVSASGCWIWQSTKTPTGYGQFGYKGKYNNTHRLVYSVVNKVTLKRFDYICHTCDQPSCCNPQHLYLGSPKANMEDKVRRGRHHEMKVTHCPRGHAYDAENTYVAPGRNNRHCRICTRIKCRLANGWTLEDALRYDKVPAGFSKNRLPQGVAHGG